MEKQAEALNRLQGVLFEEVYFPHFKQACEQLGVTFANDEDLVAGLETAAMLKAAEAAIQEQGIDTRPSFQKQSRDLLKQAMFGTAEDMKGLENVKTAFTGLLAATGEAKA